MSDMENFSYPCQKVVSQGLLCGLPCEPGFMQCLEHRQALPRREIVKLLETRQDFVLMKVESALDDAVTELIRISTHSDNDSDRLKAIDKLLTLGGFANVKIDAEIGVTLAPQERDRVLVEMVRQFADHPEKMAELEEKLGIIDASSTEA